MTLTEAAFWTKRFGVIALGLIVVLVLGVLILTYEPPATAPEKYLKPNFACTEKREEFLETGVLEIPSLKLAEGSNMLFEINTDTGKINDAIEIVNMYAYNNPTQAWDARLRAKALATKDGESTELRYFITSLTDVNLAAKAMRTHWSIENNLHWVLDTVFDEDYCRVRKDNSAQNLNIIRKLVMNLLKGLDLPVATKKKNLTIGNKQTLCLKNEKCLLYALQNL